MTCPTSAHRLRFDRRFHRSGRPVFIFSYRTPTRQTKPEVFARARDLLCDVPGLSCSGSTSAEIPAHSHALLGGTVNVSTDPDARVHRLCSSRSAESIAAQLSKLPGDILRSAKKIWTSVVDDASATLCPQPRAVRRGRTVRQPGTRIPDALRERRRVIPI